MTKKVHSKALGTLEFVGQPMTLNRTPSSFALASPECGEHTEEILESLGYSTEEIAELRGNNIV
jgi:crotonobetainyl-CoA:carnitine CoA-transferase CaiB-like acyl-CoA transferase